MHCSAQRRWLPRRYGSTLPPGNTCSYIQGCWRARKYPHPQNRQKRLRQTGLSRPECILRYKLAPPQAEKMRCGFVQRFQYMPSPRLHAQPNRVTYRLHHPQARVRNGGSSGFARQRYLLVCTNHSSQFLQPLRLGKGIVIKQHYIFALCRADTGSPRAKSHHVAAVFNQGMALLPHIAAGNGRLSSSEPLSTQSTQNPKRLCPDGFDRSFSQPAPFRFGMTMLFHGARPLFAWMAPCARTELIWPATLARVQYTPLCETIIRPCICQKAGRCFK